MAEYIEREAAMHIAFKSSFFSDALMEEMKAIPAADVATVRHGRWIAPFLSDGGNMCADCSNCHKIRIFDDYCSACGAIMDLNDLED